jgi:hypothetical protein
LGIFDEFLKQNGEIALYIDKPKGFVVDDDIYKGGLG